jgi:hypothetical protein
MKSDEICKIKKHCSLCNLREYAASVLINAPLLFFNDKFMCAERLVLLIDFAKYYVDLLQKIPY